MNREKKLLTVGGGVVLIAVVAAMVLLGGNSLIATNGQDMDTSTADVDAPENVEAVMPLAKQLNPVLNRNFNSVNLFINGSGEIYVEYSNTAKTKEQLNTEFNQIAVEYIRAAENSNTSINDTRTLTIVTDEVQAIVPEPAVKAHLRGKIDQNGLLETIEVMEVERTDRNNYDN